jgi:hypothetical protein
MAERLHYKPNVAAASLTLNRRLRIGVYLPLEIRPFFDPMRAGLRSAEDAMFGTAVELDFRTYPRLGEGDAELLGAETMRHFDGYRSYSWGLCHNRPIVAAIRGRRYRGGLRGQRCSAQQKAVPHFRRRFCQWRHRGGIAGHGAARAKLRRNHYR